MAGLQEMRKLHELVVNMLKREEPWCQQAAEVALLIDHVCQQVVSIIKLSEDNTHKISHHYLKQNKPILCIIAACLSSL